MMGLFGKKTKPVKRRKRRIENTAPKTMAWCVEQGMKAYPAEAPRRCVGSDKDGKPVFIGRDLCHVADVIAFDNEKNRVCFIQCTDHTNLAAHVTKYEDDDDCHDAIVAILEAGQRFEIQSWKKGAGLKLKRVMYSLDPETGNPTTVTHQELA